VSTTTDAAIVLVLVSRDTNAVVIVEFVVVDVVVLTLGRVRVNGVNHDVDVVGSVNGTVGSNTTSTQ